MELELKVRRRIYDLIRTFPGIHLRELERRPDIVIGSLQYHLHYLEKKRLIYSFKDEEFVRYFTRDRILEENEKNILALLRRTGCRHILINLLQNEGMNNGELSNAIGLAPSTTSWHLNKLLRGQVITKIKNGRESHFVLNEPERVAELLICYKESFLDSLLDNFAEMWDLKKARKKD
ncbi:winged helix-turn-helix transcriptional regulator [Methanococcoides seepicolus]|uniref:Winged helix-turn-helix transcriptional regulator n=1 Tax=Methanococcoides seepicolus TaxID=2828780 RepID=A0A9E5DC83_9EURY|nr:winged helix-turn-helix transcriptional regulator [Methanococcoides seepicolus]MCM1987567.1 winged helix-turn-helix transcriptional regulator [Methanococcoides seepicolus]